VRLERKGIDLALRSAWTTAHGTSSIRRNVLVRLTHDGIEGLGEAAPNPRYGEDRGSVLEALDLLAPLLGDDPSRLEEILDRLEESLPGNRSAKAAIDIALHDWVGRRRGTPLHRMLGADPRAAPPTSFSIGIDTEPAMLERAREAAGFRILKIKVGRDGGRAIVEAIRRITDKPIYVDANESWQDAPRAVQLIRWMEGMGVALVEQPLPAADLEGAKHVRDRVEMPIFADEACVTPDDLQALSAAYDGVNVKVQKSGGLRAARRMIDEARTLKMQVMIGCMIETSVGITAAAHLCPLADHVDLDGNLLISNDPFRGAVVRDGRLVLPDRPGLGLEGAW
jgi:L-alanine-DL-glutamate epimerase-like enolase superfamily enzyme